MTGTLSLHRNGAVGFIDWLGLAHGIQGFGCAFGNLIGNLMSSASGAPGPAFVFCATITRHTPPCYFASMVMIPNRFSRGEPSGFLSPSIVQLQCTTASSGARKRTIVSSGVFMESRNRPAKRRV